jgi:hypothetical protein
MIALVTIRSVGTSTVLTSSEKEALAAGARELAALELAEAAFERKVQRPTIPAAVSAPPTGNRPAAVAAPTTRTATRSIRAGDHAKEQITKLKGEKSSRVGKNWREKERERRARERREQWTGPESSEKQRRETALVRQGEKIEREREERERQVGARVMKRMTHQADAEVSADDKPCPAHCTCEKHAAPCPCCKPKDVAIMLEMPMTCADFSLEAQNKFKCAIAEVRRCMAWLIFERVNRVGALDNAQLDIASIRLCSGRGNKTCVVLVSVRVREFPCSRGKKRRLVACVVKAVRTEPAKEKFVKRFLFPPSIAPLSRRKKRGKPAPVVVKIQTKMKQRRRCLSAACCGLLIPWALCNHPGLLVCKQDIFTMYQPYFIHLLCLSFLANHDNAHKYQYLQAQEILL